MARICWILPVLFGLCCSKPAPPARTGSAEAKPALEAPYRVSSRGGTPPTGPAGRYNHCERIFCLAHGENFSVEHFLEGHRGWILHDDLRGDVFVPRHRQSGPEFPWANRNVLQLCGQHVHPHVLGRPGGPFRSGGFSGALGFDRAHYAAYGIGLERSLVNPVGWSFVHSKAGLLYRFPSREELASLPAEGWQRPFPAESPSERARPG